MKRFLLATACLLSVWSLKAQPVSPAGLERCATLCMQTLNPGLVLAGHELLLPGPRDTAGHIFTFRPTGFLIIAGSPRVSPVYAYSGNTNLDLQPDERATYLRLITADLSGRVAQSAGYPEHLARQVAAGWEAFCTGTLRLIPFQQWPPEGTTYTGGWVETNWTQTNPYNAMCPMDLNAGARSVAGCPATAMAQIVNYHRSLNLTRFDDNDDYYHSYGAGNQYWIDNDWQPRGFPAFDSLNVWLDTLESVYAVNAMPSGGMKAALTFACGVAAHQVYTASVSGTFGLEQALMAFHRFGYEESQLLYPEDTTLNQQVAENIKAGLPAQLGLLVSTGSGGHNVVVDGYNTNEFYHFNFGWGGTANGWYTLPPQSAPYNLTIIEGVIVDIQSDLYTNLPDRQSPGRIPRLAPNPFDEELIPLGLKTGDRIRVFSLQGKSLLEWKIADPKEPLHTGELPDGIYLYTIRDASGFIVSGKMVKQRQ